MKNKTILTALTESLILESYKDVKIRFINDGADKTEVESLLNLHKKLKDMNRLPKDLINIDLLAKDKTFDEFKSLMSDYSEDDTKTKTERFNSLKVVCENEYYTIYDVVSAEEAYLFHGNVTWCISSGSKKSAEIMFTKYVNRDHSIFYIAVAKSPQIEDPYRYIAIQIKVESNGDWSPVYWNSKNNESNSIPEVSKFLPDWESKVREWEPVANPNWKKNPDGTYVADDVNFNDVLDLSEKRLAFKFSKIKSGTFYDAYNIVSFEGLPEVIDDRLIIHNYQRSKLKINQYCKEVKNTFGIRECWNLLDLEGMPKCQRLLIAQCDLRSLDGISEDVETISFSGQFNFDDDNFPKLPKLKEISIRSDTKIFINDVYINNEEFKKLLLK